MAATTANSNRPTRPIFEPDGASVLDTAVQDQASPIQNSNVLARFEFESGRGNEGTKILMVEWQDDEESARQPGKWHVSWEKKPRAVLAVEDQVRQGIHRQYFLLLPGVTIPPTVTLMHKSASPSQAKNESHNMWQIKPLPAIFPPELGGSARRHSKKGILHTNWAKIRLSELQREIDSESRSNVEGVGLQIALQEKEWIEQNFGIGGRTPGGLSIPPLIIGADTQFPTAPLSPTTPVSPKTPGGTNRLAEKLKGLRVGTSERELSRRPGPTNPGNLPLTAPPTALSTAGNQASAHPIPSFTALAVPNRHEDSDSNPHSREEDGLFAVAMSPRSPDMAKSPFSFSLAERAAMILK